MYSFVFPKICQSSVYLVLLYLCYILYICDVCTPNMCSWVHLALYIGRFYVHGMCAKSVTALTVHLVGGVHMSNDW